MNRERYSETYSSVRTGCCVINMILSFHGRPLLDVQPPAGHPSDLRNADIRLGPAETGRASRTATLRWTAAVVGLRRHVRNRCGFEARRGEGTGHRLTAGTESFDEDADLLHSVFHGDAGGVLCGELCSVGRWFARAFETDLA